jgi:hypothetical protein
VKLCREPELKMSAELVLLSSGDSYCRVSVSLLFEVAVASQAKAFPVFRKNMKNFMLIIYGLLLAALVGCSRPDSERVTNRTDNLPFQAASMSVSPPSAESGNPQPRLGAVTEPPIPNATDVKSSPQGASVPKSAQSPSSGHTPENAQPNQG